MKAAGQARPSHHGYQAVAIAGHNSAQLGGGGISDGTNRRTQGNAEDDEDGDGTGDDAEADGGGGGGGGGEGTAEEEGDEEEDEREEKEKDEEGAAGTKDLQRQQVLLLEDDVRFPGSWVREAGIIVRRGWALSLNQVMLYFPGAFAVAFLRTPDELAACSSATFFATMAGVSIIVGFGTGSCVIGGGDDSFAGLIVRVQAV
jgi:hypothetical protein